MRRVITQPRQNWQQRCQAVGFNFDFDGSYYQENAYYLFSPSQIEVLENAINTLNEMAIAAVQHVIDRNLFAKLGITPLGAELCRRSWQEDEPTLYGRFDLFYDGKTAPKLYEFNADTPTSLLEAAVLQWDWLEDEFPHDDQFNALHEKLVDAWRFMPNHRGLTHFLYIDDSAEDYTNVCYLADTAHQAGREVAILPISQLGWDGNEFVDEQERRIEVAFKLYPWEWLTREEFGRHLLTSRVKWVEPPWKMILSNKGILPILWSLYPNHDNLLPAYFEPRDGFVRKPLLSREGANISLPNGIETEGNYGEEGYIWQAFCPLPNLQGNYPVIGGWVVGDEAVGMGIRESDGLISTNLSRFVPHVMAR